MKILLLSPYNCVISYGVRILSACLKQDGHDSSILFLPQTDERGLTCYNSSVVDQILELALDKDLIGISLMSNNYLIIKDLCNRLKEKLNIPIALGGVHPTVSYHDCLDFSDYIFRGESELAFREFIANFRTKIPGMLSTTDNLVYKENGNVFVNSIKLPLNLDKLPFPDYDDDHFVIMHNKLLRMTFNILQLFLKNEYMIFPTRGCPFQCAYCCNNSFHKLYKDNQIFRKRSAQNVINELLWYKEIMEAEYLKLNDDGFMALSEEYLKEFVELYKSKVDLPIAIGSLSPMMAGRIERKLDILRPLDITFVKMGVQSGSENTRKNIYLRNDSNEDILKTSKALVDRGIKYTIDIILDNPFEEEEGLIETILFLTELKKANCVTYYSLAFYPGTYLYNRAIQEKLIPDDWSKVIKMKYGYYWEVSPILINKLVMCSCMLSKNTAKAILRLKKNNLFLFRLTVNGLYRLYKMKNFILNNVQKIVGILRGKRLKGKLNRRLLGLKETIWLNSLRARNNTS
jgi:radical SAM superfamily enzyme YgiQ (UPF0313 family)